MATTLHEGPLPGNAEIRALIVNECLAQNVRPSIGLAFAYVESRFHPTAEGDKNWHLREAGRKYDELVRDAPAFADNPARLEPWKWHSYGLFQLLAPYHVGRLEDPVVLLDPAINTRRGVAAIKRFLKRCDGDPIRARILYTGASGKPEAVQQEIRTRITAALQMFAEEDTRHAL
jgi:Transglycosylase SLT domain